MAKESRDSSTAKATSSMPVSLGPTSPTNLRSQYRVRRSRLRQVRTGSCELTSDSNGSSSNAVSVRSGHVSNSSLAMSSNASSTSIKARPGRNNQDRQPQPSRLLARRAQCETPVSRCDLDTHSDPESITYTDHHIDHHIHALRLPRSKTEADLYGQYRGGASPKDSGHPLRGRLPQIGQRPVSRHVVVAMQYNDKTKSTTQVAQRSTPNTVASSFDSPRTLRAKASRSQKPREPLVTPSKPSQAEGTARAWMEKRPPNDHFVDQLTKTRIMSWLESVSTALQEETMDSTTLSAIKEEAVLP